jgi:outer membrane protein assembly factor BamD
MYYAIVDTMLTNLKMAEAVLNEMIADLYIRLDKPRSAKYYKNIKPQPWIDWDKIDRANTAWYREWFEGDGTESWYAFMIPDTQSVVSRNTLQEEYIPSVEKKPKAVEPLVDEETKPNPITTKQKQELEKAKELMESGVLSKQEYNDLKDEILKK